MKIASIFAAPAVAFRWDQTRQRYYCPFDEQAARDPRMFCKEQSGDQSMMAAVLATSSSGNLKKSIVSLIMDAVNIRTSKVMANTHLLRHFGAS